MTIVWEHSELQMEIETPVLLACAIEDSTDIFGISGGGGLTPPTPPRYATDLMYLVFSSSAQTRSIPSTSSTLLFQQSRTDTELALGTICR